MINKIKNNLLKIKSIKTYDKDGRSSLFDLYNKYFSLLDNDGWEIKQIFSQKIDSGGKQIDIPIYSLRTIRKGESLWLTSGIHGEEPSGPNAIAQNIDFIAHLVKDGMPIVLNPLCNPKGYILNWRYQNEYRNWRKGESVGDSEHLLISEKNISRSLVSIPTNRQADRFTKYILDAQSDYPTKISVDLHEDEKLEAAYIYSQGTKASNNPVTERVVQIIEESGILLQKSGKTRFGEKVLRGVITGAKDESIDELLGSKVIIKNNKRVKGPSVKTVIVVETPTVGVSIKKRILVHSNIIRSLGTLWKLG